MAKKRTSLEAMLNPVSSGRSNSDEIVKPETTSKQSQIKPKIVKPILVEPVSGQVAPKAEIVKQTVYLPAGVYEQLRLLAFEERRKMHDYLVEGLDRVFKDRGLKPFDELTVSKNNRD